MNICTSFSKLEKYYFGRKQFHFPSKYYHTYYNVRNEFILFLRDMINQTMYVFLLPIIRLAKKIHCSAKNNGGNRLYFWNLEIENYLHKLNQIKHENFSRNTVCMYEIKFWIIANGYKNDWILIQFYFLVEFF